MNRPKTYTIAAILHLLLSLYNIVDAVPLLMSGSAQVDQSPDAPPYLIVLLAFALGVLGLVSAYGVWRNQKWGVILTIFLQAVSGISALPGLIFAPVPQLMVIAGLTVVGALVVIGLLLFPKATAAATPGTAR